ncbi:LLM class flavin-dependent oxidoreductase [Nocardiopsis exhalans]|uniref:LLM class flavin-dependent oxidoreductase n=1 Tax=Nocardiopsis exhalans TaxID=163604 RepID=A0ABY5DG03_9ACTN|nr:LLM class flavin-dependent oxidoreductase [Nocardiopsis exhalans]
MVLGDGTPALEPALTLAATAPVTRRVRLGFGVLSVPPRPAPWLAAQIATLQHLSANRLLLGVGIGGFPGSPLWRALGVPAKGRGRATDATLELLPPLVTGEDVRFEEADTTLRLAPAAPMPPVLVGGTEKAFDRILRLGAGWFPSLLSPTDLGAAASRLRARAEERGLPSPPVTVGGHLILGTGSSARKAYESLVRQLVEEHGVPEAEAARSPVLARTPEELAELYTAYAEAGADRVVAGADNLGWEEQLDFIGQARALLPR